MNSRTVESEIILLERGEDLTKRSSNKEIIASNECNAAYIDSYSIFKGHSNFSNFNAYITF
jgi:hypothetical protein